MTGQAPGRTAGVADQQHGWTERLPPPLRDRALLARFDRPIGTWLLLLPCWWGLALPVAGAGGVERIGYGLLMGLGAIVMRGAGCTVNDLADREFDRKVARTANRPLAAGRISVRGALAFLAVLLLMGLGVLLFLPRAAQAVAVLSLPLVVVYPFMKRLTWWPQAFLGITFNWGALVGFAAATGGLGLPALLLYAAGFFWTLGYDTVYAHQDKEDDALIGVRSTARLLGESTPLWLVGFYGATLLLMTSAMALAGQNSLGFLALALPAWLLWRNVDGLRLDDPADCLARFRAHRGVGLAFLLALVLGQIPV
ncbi:MAG: 4-hydroxybenzoate octaprenyltransferase [Geminicoccaceae bacterium]|nr:4-hydroxybenzoate octaprenyltransferase [Geminicoccaceae bacterium]